MGKRAESLVRASVLDMVERAFGEAEELKDEVQNWFDNLHENLQGGDKGQKLEEIVGQLENYDMPTPPERIKVNEIEFTESVKKRMSRRERLDNCVAAVRAAAEHTRAEIEGLEALAYDKHGHLAKGDQPAASPNTEDERDTIVEELEQFAQECEDAADEWDSVEFPGMYG